MRVSPSLRLVCWLGLIETRAGTAFTALGPLYANYTPSLLPFNSQIDDTLLASVESTVNSIYSNDPAQGSPYGTGSDTFGQGAGFKKLASISASPCASSLRNGC